MGKDIEDLTKVWQDYVDLQENDKFVLNLDNKIVKSLAKGVLENEKKHGLKFCPCQVTTGNMSEDIGLICPCNFKIQNTWKEKGECWCSLFVKK